ncbi:hypothetical protein QQ056_17030 [Oscillatoria laete-virens NRMC-F 0139]|nr:hypothetical protein [Oscillatoria laete-virens]MDL5055237.1 hypothetical protein [Oscillatoria laete-virens NRMC-F 0139]
MKKLIPFPFLFLLTLLILLVVLLFRPEGAAQIAPAKSTGADIEVFIIDPYRQPYDPLDERTKLYPRVDWITGKNRDKPVTAQAVMAKGFRFVQIASFENELWMIFIKGE